MFEEASIKSDLVIEYAEQFYNTSEQKDKKIPGVEMHERSETDAEIHVTDVHIYNQEGAALIGKPQGRYITVDAKHLPDGTDAYHKAVTEVLMAQLRVLVPNIEEKQILVAGIGNKDVTPDALGPLAVSHLLVTRHLFRTYGEDSTIVKGMGRVSAVTPGVMAQTGMETAEILRGLIEETKPDLLIVIDALAARSIRRLITTLQLTNTGIHPGAGIGNHRYELTEETLGVPVIAIGMPTVIDAATIVADTMENLLQALDEDTQLQRVVKTANEFSYEEKHRLMRELMEPQMMNLFVTPKDIDASVERISFTISEAINSLCHDLNQPIG